LTISDIADYCALKDCKVTLGDPAVGFIEVDSGGYSSRPNYARFLMFNELSGLASPQKVLTAATSFQVSLSRGPVTFSREQFEAELRGVREKVTG
jgi:hypothetical protein